MPALLVSHHGPAFYFRVTEVGDLGSGGEIMELADGPEQKQTIVFLQWTAELLA